MASSLMHLAATGRLADGCARPDLLRLGSVLVDARGQAGHFRGQASDGRRFYDLDRFRAQYGDQLFRDDFYLGTYLHLVQDMLYRKFLYVDHRYRRSPEAVAQLHEDYRRLNPFLVRKYALRPLRLPSELAGHPLLADNAEAFLADMRGQFLPCDDRPVVLTESMAVEYIDQATVLCRAELDALRNGTPGVDPMDYAYGPRIRELHPEETPLLETFLYHAIFQRDPAHPLPRDVIRRPELWIYVDRFGQWPGDRCLCAEENGRVVGAVWTRLIHGYGHVDDRTPELAISVLPEARGGGVGTALLRAMLARLRADGCSQVTLSVQKDNFALRMYQRAGFTLLGETAEEVLMECRP